MQNIQESFKNIKNELTKYTTTQDLNILYKVIQMYRDILRGTNITDYLLIDSNPEIPRYMYIDAWTELGQIYMILMKKKPDQFVEYCNNCIECFVTILNVDFENNTSKKELINIYNALCQHACNNGDYKIALVYLKRGLSINPIDYTIHNNLGFVFKCLNDINISIIHYKLAIELNKGDSSVKANSYSGLSCNFRAIQKWPQALYYLLQAEEIMPNDPDIQNSLGLVYTEMRRTDLAELSYLKAISNYKMSKIYENNPQTLLEDLYLNYGHMIAFNGDNLKSIEQYNKVLTLNKTHKLAFQNKIMNLIYLYNDLTDTSYITKQHLLINKILTKRINNKNNFVNEDGMINIGIISGDFINHPVSYFISTFLTNYNCKLFNVYCYSECLIDTNIFNKTIKFSLIKNKSTDQVCNELKNDKIQILFDLSGHTSHNRMDVFAQKPVDIQVSYIGYPYTTGLKEMDYRITDNICDKIEVSQKHYTEKLVYLEKCFLCYNPLQETTIDLKQLPLETPFTIGCFNRLNKISNDMITLIDLILTKYPNINFLFKTKALLNKKIKQEFLQKFSNNNINRINIIDCALLHYQHLQQYNLVHISIDTFPYSGTTTTCESLYMGVPVLSLYDDKTYYHPQNVSTSILKNSDLNYYVSNSTTELIEKIGEIINKKEYNQIHFKEDIRERFLNGNVCNTTVYMENIQDLIKNLVKNHKE
jgi:protein O-GlcNAc transferase